MTLFQRIVLILIFGAIFAVPTNVIVAQTERQPSKVNTDDHIDKELLNDIKDATPAQLRRILRRFLTERVRFHAQKDFDVETYLVELIGMIHAKLGNYKTATLFLTQAVRLNRKYWIEPEDRVRDLVYIGVIQSIQGAREKAANSFEQALKACDDKFDCDEAQFRKDIEKFNDLLGRGNSALNTYDQVQLRRKADKLFDEASEIIVEPTAESLIEKIKTLEEALRLYRLVSGRGKEAEILKQLTVLVLNSDPQKSLDYAFAALKIYQKIGPPDQEGEALSNIGHVYTTFGELQRALEYFKRALPLVRTRKDPSEEIDVLTMIAQLSGELDDPQRGIDYYQQLLTRERAVGNPFSEAATLRSIATYYDQLGDRKKALEYLNQALEVLPKKESTFSPVAAEKSDIFLLLGILYREMGDRQKASDFLNQSLSLSRSVPIGRSEREAGILAELAFLEDQAGNLTKGLAFIEEAVAILEKIRAGIADKQLRSQYYARVRGFYDYQIDLLMRLHRQEPGKGNDLLALQVSERFRGRVLLETLAEAKANIRQGVEPQLVERERTLQQQLNTSAERQMRVLSRPHDESQAAAIAKEIESLTAEFQQVERQIQQTSPRYAALTQPQPLTPVQIQDLLDENTLLLEYTLGKDRSYLWAVTRESITGHELPARDEIEAASRRFYDLLNARIRRVKGETKEQWQTRVAQADADIPKAAEALSLMVLAPINSQLGTKRLVIVADGALQYIPFAALTFISINASVDQNGSTDQQQITSDKYQPLIADHEIVTLPSASTLAVIRREVAGRQLAPKMVFALADPVFTKNDERVMKVGLRNNVQAKDPAGVPQFEKPENLKELQLIDAAAETGLTNEGFNIPRLPGSRSEAEDIVAMAPPQKSKLALDFDASRETTFSTDLSEYRLVHFSTHGFLNSSHPELSGIVLSLVNERGETQDGFLRAHEIFNLNLPAELVVLSACQTGLGKEVKAEGLSSLTRAFMYAGAPRVVVSLWSVSEMGTKELMVRFYSGMLKEGKPPAAALRDAQISLMKEKRWAPPFYWAPFILQGEWR